MHSLQCCWKTNVVCGTGRHPKTRHKLGKYGGSETLNDVRATPAKETCWVKNYQTRTSKSFQCGEKKLQNQLCTHRHTSYDKLHKAQVAVAFLKPRSINSSLRIQPAFEFKADFQRRILHEGAHTLFPPPHTKQHESVASQSNLGTTALEERSISDRRFQSVVAVAEGSTQQGPRWFSGQNTYPCNHNE